MSVEATGWVFRYSQSRGGDRLVLLAIANRADEEGQDSWPSLDKIAAAANMHRRTVQDCIGNLAAIGELSIEHGKGKDGANLYHIRMDNLPLSEGPYRRKAPRGKRKRAPRGGWSRHRGGVGHVTAGGVGHVTVSGGGHVTVVRTSCTSKVRPKNNTAGAAGGAKVRQAGQNNGAPRRVPSPELLAAAQGRKHQRGVIRRLAWDMLDQQAKNPAATIIGSGTFTSFLEAMASELERLNIAASPEQITRAASAMWDADFRKRHGPAALAEIRRLQRQSPERPS